MNAKKKASPRHAAASGRSTIPREPASSAPSLGERIRELRLARRWSLSELSQRSSIAVSTLSKVENGKLSLAYDRLLLMAAAFDLSLSDFLAAARNEVNSAAIARISWARRASGSVVETDAYVYHYLCTNLRVKRMVPILSQVKARSLAEFGRPLRHEGEEFVFAHRGRIEVHTEFYEPQILEEGEGVYIDSRMGHAYTNAGPGEAWILSVNTNPAPEPAVASDTKPADTRRSAR